MSVFPLMMVMVYIYIFHCALLLLLFFCIWFIIHHYCLFLNYAHINRYLVSMSNQASTGSAQQVSEMYEHTTRCNSLWFEQQQSYCQPKNGSGSTAQGQTERQPSR
jgi:hypothetical protein